MVSLPDAKKAAMMNPDGVSIRHASWDDKEYVVWRGNAWLKAPGYTAFRMTDHPQTGWEIKERPLRSHEAVNAALAQLAVLIEQGYMLFPLRPESKLPRDRGWATIDYSEWVDKHLAHHLRIMGNVGVRLGMGQVVVDIDPRNGGNDSFGWLEYSVDLDSLNHTLIVDTGSGGCHFYLTIPDHIITVGQLRSYPGIDFKHFGGFVVAPGSVHPDTGRPYTIRQAEPTQAASDQLVDLITKPPGKPRTGDGGELTCEEARMLLDVLDPRDFGQGGRYHSEWLDIAMAVHDGTDGEGLEEWLDWCARDPQYGEEASEMNTRRWESFESGADDGRTYKTLLRAVVRAGRKDLVKSLGIGDAVHRSAADDFPDDLWDELEL